jgi:sodium transport system permease protein
MRWSMIRLIWLRELRDQIRDRRTLFMIFVLPLLLYPVLGYAVLKFAVGFVGRPSTIGMVAPPRGTREFPEREATHIILDLPTIACSAMPALTGPLESVGAAVSLHLAHQLLDYPPLIRASRLSPTSEPRFTTFERQFPEPQASQFAALARLKIVFVQNARQALADKHVDLVLSAPPDFYERLECEDRLRWGNQPRLEIEGRPDDDHSRQAANRLTPLLESWKRTLKDVRLLRQELPANFTDPFALEEPGLKKSPQGENLFDLFVRIFPFMLVMWCLAGALYPAVDLCAGEKERGTMETLLITPAGREEIVLGKFLTIWLFSAGTALLNLLSMGLTTWQFASQFAHGGLPLAAILWCVLLLIPLSAFFSAVCLAIGAYARSSKEGQYYLMPLFVVTMPLIFLTLAPGVELSPFYSLMPVTGIALLMQRLMATTGLDQVPWLYFIPVLAPMGLYSGLALRWAIEQFQREEVLFREAERLDVRLWLRHLLREKEETATTGQALFCFGLIVLLTWLSQGLGQDLLIHTGVRLIALTAAPVMLMAVMLNTRPRQTLYLNWPHWREIGLAALLALLLLPPLAGLADWVFASFPRATDLLEVGQPLVRELRLLAGSPDIDPSRYPWLPYLLVFALLPAICEELAFRGFILSGLQRRFRPRTAILLSSFLFALFQMNVFLFLPYFFLGVIGGLLTVRSKSLLPAIIFHLLHNAVLILFLSALASSLPIVIGLCLVTALSLLWWLYRKPYVAKAREKALQRELREEPVEG